MNKRADRKPGSRIHDPFKLTIIERLRKADAVQARSSQRKRGPLGPLWESIRLNLDWVLNSRLAVEKPDEAFEELGESMYVYGVRDLAGSRLSSEKESIRLRTELADLITLFEPRLTEVSVDSLDSPIVGTLGFRINALVWVVPDPERASFNVEAKAGSGKYDVEAVS